MSQDSDRRRILFKWMFGGVVTASALFWAGRTSAMPKTVTLEALPEPVKQGRDNFFPPATTKAKWHTAVKIEVDKKVSYEIDGTIDTDKDVTLTISEKGEVVECDTKLKSPSELPKTILASIKKKWQHFEPSEAQEIHLGENLKKPADGEVVYDVHGHIAKNRDINVQVSAKGVILESMVEVPNAKVPKKIMDAFYDAHPKFTIEVIYTVHEKDKVIGYQFECKGPKDNPRTIMVAKDGSTVEEIK